MFPHFITNRWRPRACLCAQTVWVTKELIPFQSNVPLWNVNSCDSWGGRTSSAVIHCTYCHPPPRFFCCPSRKQDKTILKQTAYFTSISRPINCLTTVIIFETTYLHTTCVTHHINRHQISTSVKKTNQDAVSVLCNSCLEVQSVFFFLLRRISDEF